MRFKISPDALDRFAGHLRLAGNGSAAFFATSGVVSTSWHSPVCPDAYVRRPRGRGACAGTNRR